MKLQDAEVSDMMDTDIGILAHTQSARFQILKWTKLVLGLESSARVEESCTSNSVYDLLKGCWIWLQPNFCQWNARTSQEDGLLKSWINGWGKPHEIQSRALWSLLSKWTRNPVYSWSNLKPLKSSCSHIQWMVSWKRREINSLERKQTCWGMLFNGLSYLCTPVPRGSELMLSMQNKHWPGRRSLH